MISRLGSMLVREGLLTPSQHLIAVEEAEDTDTPFVSVVIRQGCVSEDRLVEIMRERLLVPEAPREAITNAPANLIGLVPARMAQQFLVCPILAEDTGSLTLLMADASDRHATDEVGYHTGLRVSRMVTTESIVRWAVQHYYKMDMDQAQPPWEQQAQESVALLTKVKIPTPAPPKPVPSEVMLLTPQMRRATSDAAGQLPPMSAPAEGPKPPPMVATPAAAPTAAPPPAPGAMQPSAPPSAPGAMQPAATPPPTAPAPVPSRRKTSPGGLVAVPPLPSLPAAPRGQNAHVSGTIDTQDTTTLPEPTAVPSLPASPMEHTATGRKAARSKTISYRKGRRKRQETIQGLPSMDSPRIRDAAAYTVSGTVETNSPVPTKLNAPRVQQEVDQRSEPEPRANAGMWSASHAGPAMAGGGRSEAYSGASLALKRARTRDDVGRILFRYFQEFYLNVAFLVLKKGEIAGWDAEGIKLTKERITRISIPTDQHSTFRDVIVGRLPRRGQLDETPVDLKFQASIGYRPQDVSLVPVMIRDKVIGIIYSDGIHVPIPGDEVNGLLAYAEAAYERIILEGRSD